MREPSVSPAAARITLHEHSRRPEGGAASCLPGFDAGKTTRPRAPAFGRALDQMMVLVLEGDAQAAIAFSLGYWRN